MKKHLIFICFLGVLLPCRYLAAQELNCNVTVVQSPKAQITNVQILKSLETSIKQFLNTRKWTNDVFGDNEKIKCNIVLTIENNNGSNYTGVMQVTAIRPVYGSSYTTQTLNFNDKNIAFSYIQFQAMNYQEGVYSDELTALLAYYANIIIGYDYDSFSPLGGTPFFKKAMSIVNAAAGSPNQEGWGALSKDQNNRYALASELMDDRYKNLRQAFYTYYRQGLDYMFQDNTKGLNGIMNSLKSMHEVNDNYPGSTLYNTFFDAKWQELVNVFAQAPSSVKSHAKDLLVQMDVGNAQHYEDGLK